jgi:hypothetical protein
MTTTTQLTMTQFVTRLAGAGVGVGASKQQIHSIVTNYAMYLGVISVIEKNNEIIDWSTVYDEYIVAADANKYDTVTDEDIAQLQLQCIVLFPHCTVCNITNTDVVLLHRGDLNFYNYVQHTHTQINMWYDEYMKNKKYMVTM